MFDFDISDSEITYFDTITYTLKKAVWEYQLCLIPRKCIKSGKWMWLTRVAHGVRTIPAALAGEREIIEHYYMDTKEFTLWCLTR
jgi:hypothetical protein